MGDDLRDVDPRWAWEPYEPDERTPWDTRRAAHLFRRAGFSADWSRLQAAVAESPQRTIDRLFDDNREPAEFRNEIRQLADSLLATGDAKNLPAWWIYRMQRTSAQLLEKTTLFWHGHFATSAEKVTDPDLMYRQNEMLREHALGNFGTMVQRISKDPAMLLYLDSQSNRKSHPNENYARELMELFCMGEGQYSEQDIRELARCFTGWELRRGRFRFNRYQHDFGKKTVLGTSGELGGEQGVRVVLEQSATPRFVARKLVRFFVLDEPELSDELVDPLAEQFRREGLEIEPLVRRILGSRLFFSDRVVGRKIRSPVELALGLLRALDATTNVNLIVEGVERLGQHVFHPPNVKGWDGGRAWINSSTLLGRANLVGEILESDKTRYARGDLDELLNTHDLVEDADVVDRFAVLLLAVELPDQVRSRLIDLMGRSEGDRSRRAARVIHAMGALPEFQLA